MRSPQPSRRGRNNGARVRRQPRTWCSLRWWVTWIVQSLFLILNYLPAFGNQIPWTNPASRLHSRSRSSGNMLFLGQTELRGNRPLPHPTAPSRIHIKCSAPVGFLVWDPWSRLFLTFDPKDQELINCHQARHSQSNQGKPAACFSMGWRKAVPNCTDICRQKRHISRCGPRAPHIRTVWEFSKNPDFWASS